MAVRTTRSYSNAAAGTDRVSTMVQTLLEMDSVPRPPESLNALLDATERCVSRYGVAHASMSHLAREMNIARTTLYRQVGSIDEALALVGSRILYQFLDEFGAAMQSGKDWRRMFMDTAVRAVELIRERPLIRRVLEHEPEIVGSVFTTSLGALMVRRLTDLGAPVMATAMAAQQVRYSNPRLAAELLARTILSLVVLPSEGDLEQIVQFSLAPILEV